MKYKINMGMRVSGGHEMLRASWWCCCFPGSLGLEYCLIPSFKMDEVEAISLSQPDCNRGVNVHNPLLIWELSI